VLDNIQVEEAPCVSPWVLLSGVDLSLGLPILYK